jgi:DtxR family Mn-dependent transcriptional regulator
MNSLPPLSAAEENYLKALFHLTCDLRETETGTNRLAAQLGLSPASVNAMLKKLKEKDLVEYERYGKLKLSSEGHRCALILLRKHRLWETFLYRHLGFGWDEIHEVAEQLEHIRSPKLIEELDRFMGRPRFDPHGDAIPDELGGYEPAEKKTLDSLEVGTRCRIASVRDSSAAFLQHLSELGLGLRSEMQLIERKAFDRTLVLRIENRTATVSERFAQNVFVIESKPD